MILPEVKSSICVEDTADELLGLLTAGADRTGRPLSLTDRLTAFRKLCERGYIHTLEPLLPLLLTLKGEPYTLRDHFPFAPLFRTKMVPNMCVITGRQVSKSTSIASNGVIVANSISHFATLYVTPLFEQVRRLSGNYVRPFIDQSPVKSLWSGSSTENSVLQRSFKNNSKMYFSFAFLDADRIRGISADRLCVDESVRVHTMVDTPFGPRPIESFQPGDPVWAFDHQGICHEDEIVKCSDHGERDCYRFEFADGSAVEATSDSWLATTSGWKRVEAVISDLGAGADASRHDAGRRIFAPTLSSSDLHRTTRLVPARIQLPQVPGITRVRTDAAQESTERRLRRVVERIQYADPAGLLPYRFFVLPARQEVGEQTVAGSTDLGGRGLVVHGRRHADQGQDERILHSRIHRAGSRFDGCVVRGEGHRDEESPSQITAQARQILSGNKAVRRLDVQAHCADSAICLPGDGLQGSSTGTLEDASVRLVPRNVSVSDRRRREGKIQTQHDQELLRLSCLPANTSQGEQRAPSRQTGQTGGVQQECTRSLSRRPGSRAYQGARECCQPLQKQSCIRESSQTTAPGESTSGQEAGSLDLPVVWSDGTARRQGRQAEVLPAGLPGRGHQGNQAGLGLKESALVKVTWTGRHRVFDIETKKYNTFFAGGVAVHNCQDIDPDLLPVIREVMSHSKWGITWYTGTPKTEDNVLERYWQRTSQAEWFIKCGACNYWNIPGSEFDLIKMIGPVREDISEHTPGIVCAKCQVPINPRAGRWVHRYPERRDDFSGFHIPQVIMPVHYGSRKKWAEMIGKMNGAGNTTKSMFYNEVLGESLDESTKLVTETDLKKAASLPWVNKPEDFSKPMKQIKHYPYRCLAVDWGGGGEGETSFTTLAVLGWKPNGGIDVLWGRRLLTPHEHIGEAKECLRVFNAFNCHFLAHDYTGAGSLRETFINHAGVPLNKIIPISYVRTASRDLISTHAATKAHPRDYHMLDKARSLQLVCNCIKLGMIKFFQYDYMNSDNPGLLWDFLALVENKVDTAHAGDLYTIVRNPMFKDDFAQAVNIGSCALWHATKSWPNLAQIAHLQLSAEQLKAAAPPADMTWHDEGQGGMGGYLGRP